jgi:hypothetical protein
MTAGAAAVQCASNDCRRTRSTSAGSTFWPASSRLSRARTSLRCRWKAGSCEPLRAGIAGPEVLAIDQVLVDRHRVAAACERRRDHLAVRVTGAGGACRVGGHPPSRLDDFAVPGSQEDAPLAGFLAAGGSARPGPGRPPPSGMRWWSPAARPSRLRCAAAIPAAPVLGFHQGPHSALGLRRNALRQVGKRKWYRRPR